MACAYALPKSQLKGVGVLAGVGPSEDGFAHMRLGSNILLKGLHYTSNMIGRIADWTMGQKARDPNFSNEVLKDNVDGERTRLDREEAGSH